MRAVLAAAVATLAVAAPAPAASVPPPSNERVLTPKHSAALADYARAVRGCLRKLGYDADRPSATSRHISIPIDGPVSQEAAVAGTLRCAERLGGPPRLASLQAFAGKVVLYVPKQCLIDADVLRSLR